MKKIAIIGSGISGLTCAYLLNRQHQITLFEQNEYIGGHTATIDIQMDDTTYAIDTGFIVFNDWTYPNFIRLMDQLGVPRQPTEMSFSVKNLATGLEYNGNNLNSLFAQRRNLVSPTFYRMVSDILRFNRDCKEAWQQQQIEGNSSETLGDFIRRNRYGQTFIENYIAPMCAAIWSTSLQGVEGFPLTFFLKFFNNHGLLNVVNRPQWYTIVGGSREYIAPLTRDFSEKICLNSQISAVYHQDNQIVVEQHNADKQVFDDVIFACHSDQALKLIAKPTASQQDILGDIQYADNEVVVHTDTSVLPQRPLAWASWNYQLNGTEEEKLAPAAVTYNMNILQRIEAPHTFCVTLNNTAALDQSRILRTFRYAHPQFSHKSLHAQQRRLEICGQDNMHFCGAYWYNGFHEDGVRSALDVCARFDEYL